jgi:hypothetical protein
MIDQTVTASLRPFGIAVPAQIRGHDMEMRLQFARDRIPVAAMVEPAMNQDQRRRGFVAPVDIVQPQPLGLIKAVCRFGHHGIVSRGGEAPISVQIRTRARSASRKPATLRD